MGFLAHGCEAMLTDERAHPVKAGACRRPRAQPAGQALPLRWTLRRAQATWRPDAVTDSRKPLRSKVFLSAPRPRRLGYDRDALEL